VGLGNLKIGRFNMSGSTTGSKAGSLGVNVGSDGIPDAVFDLTSISSTSDVQFYVAKIDLRSSAPDSVSLWLNPSLNSSFAPTPQISISGLDLGFDSLSLESTNVGYQQMLAYYDEFRIGTLWTDVVTIPEPSSLSLLALGGVVVALRRRR
jgi:hypothetical protein